LSDLRRCAHKDHAGGLLPVDQFNVDRRMPDKLAAWCKACKSRVMREKYYPERKAAMTRANGEPPIPMEDEPTAPGIPPPSLSDPSKPDYKAYSGQAPKFRLLHIDIETSPLLAYTWGTFKQNISVEQIIEPTSVLCFAAQWHGSSEVIYHEARVRPSLEFNLMIRAAHNLLSECDAVCHYNGQKFDVPRLNREFLKLGMGPTPPLHQVDLWQAVTKFSMDSSKLAFVGPELGIGEKIKHDGWGLWKGCMDGNAASWAKMREYCMGDVVQLPALYTKLLPWLDKHPNMNLYVADEEGVCPKCGSSEVVRSDDHKATTLTYKRYACRACGAWSRARTRDKNGPSADLR
jgi:predicted RNA-binding Zn-ribbon protein involved in translation (DUF1610 family)